MRISRISVAPALLLLAGGCDLFGSDSGSLRLALSTRENPAAAAIASPMSADVSITAGGATMVLSKVELVARMVRFRTGGASCPAATTEGGDPQPCPTIVIGPVLLDFPLDGSADVALSADVPAGTYQEVAFQIHAPTATAGDQAFVAANPDFDGVSIRVTGTYNGTPFTYTTGLTVVKEVALSPAIEVVDGQQTKVTLHADVRGWFTQDPGGLIDPAQLATSQQLRARVEQNILASFRLFEDENTDGVPE